jgi:hypothetical protein
MSRRACLLIALAIGLVASGCGPWFYSVTTPPPTRTAELNTKDKTITLSPGVALGVICEKSGPCRNASATSDDPNIARILPAHLNHLHYAGFAGNRQAATFVVVGITPGKTKVRVTSSDGDKTLTVTVLDDQPARSPDVSVKSNMSVIE